MWTWGARGSNASSSGGLAMTLAFLKLYAFVELEAVIRLLATLCQTSAASSTMALLLFRAIEVITRGRPENPRNYLSLM